MINKRVISILLGVFWGFSVSAYASQCYPDAQSAYYALLAQEKQHAQSDKININTASMGELVTLHGVGAKTAHAIIEYRRTNGAFSSVDELTQVKGIGSKTLEKNRHRLTVF